LPLIEPKYKYNQSILELFDNGDGHKKIKLITMSILRTSGIEDDEENYTERGTVNDEKLKNNIARTKSKIFELAFCNPWDWFFTGTLNSKYDRTNLKDFHKNLTDYIKSYNRYHKTKIKFLLIPELHLDGKTWHMHGFLHDLPKEHLKRFKIGDKMGRALAKKVRNGEETYNWPAYAERFGFCDLEPIRNHEAVSKYVTKYINKNLANSVTELNAHQYYHSRGLKEAEIIKKGAMLANFDIVPDYANEYCSVAWLDYSDELLQALKDCFR